MTPFPHGFWRTTYSLYSLSRERTYIICVPLLKENQFHDSGPVLVLHRARSRHDRLIGRRPSGHSCHWQFRIGQVIGVLRRVCYGFANVSPTISPVGECFGKESARFRETSRLFARSFGRLTVFWQCFDWFLLVFTSIFLLVGRLVVSFGEFMMIFARLPPYGGKVLRKNIIFRVEKWETWWILGRFCRVFHRFRRLAMLFW